MKHLLVFIATALVTLQLSGNPAAARVEHGPKGRMRAGSRSHARGTGMSVIQRTQARLMVRHGPSAFHSSAFKMEAFSGGGGFRHRQVKPKPFATAGFHSSGYFGSLTLGARDRIVPKTALGGKRSEAGKHSDLDGFSFLKNPFEGGVATHESKGPNFSGRSESGTAGRQFSSRQSIFARESVRLEESKKSKNGDNRNESAYGNDTNERRVGPFAIGHSSAFGKNDERTTYGSRSYGYGGSRRDDRDRQRGMAERTVDPDL